MAKVKILSWNGIPAQVRAREDGARRPVNVQMPDWFGQEIDRVAMRDGLIESDAYLAAWQWSDETDHPGKAADIAQSVADELATNWGHPFTHGGAGPSNG